MRQERVARDGEWMFARTKLGRKTNDEDVTQVDIIKGEKGNPWKTKQSHQLLKADPSVQCTVRLLVIRQTVIKMSYFILFFQH